MIKTVAVFTLLLLPAIASAQSIDSVQKAQQLGTILAAEDFCQLSYDQDAIGQWIDENTDPADMGFSGSLTMMTDGSIFMQADMSESSKTAHCRSIERTARHFGFIE